MILTGFRNAFGLGRSGKSKALPFILLALNLFPAVILVGVMVLVGLDELPIGYAAYASTTQVLLGIFVAAQAPVLFSRDLRHGSIALYLARPLRASTYALARWTSLLLATFVFLLLPVAAAVRRRAARRARLHRADRERRQGPVLRLLLALNLTGIAGLIASWSTRRGFAVVATIAVLLIGNGIVTAIMGIAERRGPLPGRRGRRAVLAVLPLPRLHHRVRRRNLAHAAHRRGDEDRLPRRLRRDLGREPRRHHLALPQAHARTLLPLPPRRGRRMSTITIDSVSRWYGNVVAVNGISMTVGPGVTGLLGPNGAGKTTLIALMAGFLAPSAGSVTLDGTAIWRHTDAYRTIGLVPEREVSFGYLTGRQFVLANAELHGLADPGAAAQRALEIVEMVEPAERRIGTYSKGMRQRAKLASALVHDPAVLLLDEPFNGVDPRQRLHLMALLRQMGAEGRTVLFSSHILEEVEQVARQIEVVVSGRHAASGDFGQIRRLMTDRPVQYVVVSDGDRTLASALIAEPSVVAVSLRAQGGVDVSVSDFGAFAVRLPRLARDHGVRILELAPTDESLESVFAYLVGA